MSDLKDILRNDSGGENPLSDEQMLAYMEGRLSPAEARLVEETLNNSGAESDALEGLQELGTQDARTMKAGLDVALSGMLRKKNRRQRKGIAQQRWTWLAIGIILLLAMLGYALMWLLRHPHHH